MFWTMLIFTKKYKHIVINIQHLLINIWREGAGSFLFNYGPLVPENLQQFFLVKYGKFTKNSTTSTDLFFYFIFFCSVDKNLNKVVCRNIKYTYASSQEKMRNISPSIRKHILFLVAMLFSSWGVFWKLLSHKLDSTLFLPHWIERPNLRPLHW